MRLALSLAARAGARTRPNPMVGAVLVRDGRIVGQGFHRVAGGPHAEVLALRRAGARARGATLYVSLEPCAHTGRTPPCTEAIQAAGVRKVVAAMVDPNPRNRGRGLRWLKRRGIRTSVGILEQEARRLNEVFVTWMTAGRPFVTVKVAQSLDGKIAAHARTERWISGAAARRWVHRLRSEMDAILVGIETVLKDDPRLTVRLGRRPLRPPLKVVLDSRLRTPPSARLFASGTPVVIATTATASREREQRLRRAGADVWRLPSSGGRVDLKSVLKRLAHSEITHLLVEGGAEVIASAFAARIVDRIYCVIAPKIIGGRGAPTSVEGVGAAFLSGVVQLESLTVRCLGSDLLVTAERA